MEDRLLVGIHSYYNRYQGAIEPYYVRTTRLVHHSATNN